MSLGMHLYMLPVKIATKGEMELIKRNCVAPSHLTDEIMHGYEMVFHVGEETVTVLHDGAHNGLYWWEEVAVVEFVETVVTAGGVALLAAIGLSGGWVVFGVGTAVILLVGLNKEELLDYYKMDKDLLLNFPKAFSEAHPQPLEPCEVIGREYLESMGVLSPIERDDPLILDLNGDGVQTINVNAGVYFDNDADGFAEATGWAGPKDGLLVLDRNGDGKINDGRELFGDETILKSGQKASNGFEALAEFDDNNDGKIDVNDKVYAQLKAWQDANADGISTPDELHSLDELGIAAINLDSAPTDSTDSQGNAQTRLGMFERTDGGTGLIGEFRFKRNPTPTIPTEWPEMPADIALLPDLAASGVVHNLHQAMVRDTTDQLKSLVEQFADASDTGARNALMEQILFKWTGSDSLGPSSRGPNIDARRLAVLERFMGIPWVGPNGSNPAYENALAVKEIYRKVFEHFYAALMAQTHLKSIHNRLFYTLNEQTQAFQPHFTLVEDHIKQTLNDDPNQGKQLLSEFARTLRGSTVLETNSYLSFREAFIQQDSNLAWAFDTGGLSVIDHLGQGIRPWSRHMLGTDNTEAVRGSLTEGDGYVNGAGGDDVIYGTSRNEILINEDGNALLVAGGGNDTIWAYAGNDILDGGEGNDLLYGGEGNDTYIFRRGSGQDTIIDPDATAGNTDTIWLGSNLTPDEIALKRVGNNLVLYIIGTTDTLTIKDFFKNDSGLNRVERIQFMNGTVWTEADIIQKAYAPSEGDDVIYGSPENDSLSGLGGNDTVYGCIARKPSPNEEISDFSLDRRAISLLRNREQLLFSPLTRLSPLQRGMAPSTRCKRYAHAA